MNIPPPDTRAGVRSEFLGLGFEKLDRDLFDPAKAYPFLAGTGVSWIRLQSGWQRTERAKGVYDFAWLDAIVDSLLDLGLRPWMCLCYGNGLYDDLLFGMFRLENSARGFVYWQPAPLHTVELETSATFVWHGLSKAPLLADPLAGTVERLPEGSVKRIAPGTFTLRRVPVRDTPLFLLEGTPWENP